MAPNHNKYRDLRVSVPSSIMAAQLIVAYGQKENWFELLLVPGYYPALLSSAIMAFLIFFYINRTDRYLERVQPWTFNYRMRLFLQLVYAGIGPLFIGFLMASVYFELYGYHIWDTVYFLYYFLPIMTYVILINVYYNAEYIVFLRNGRQLSQSDMPIIDTTESEYGGEPAETVRSQKEVDALQKYVQEHNISVIRSSGGVSYAANAGGQPVIWMLNMRDSMAVLPPDLFFRVRRNCIVSRDIISQVIHDADAHRIYIVLAGPFEEEYHLPKEANEGFLNWLQSE